MLKSYNPNEIGQMTGEESTTSVGFVYLIQNGNELNDFYNYFNTINNHFQNDFLFQFYQDESSNDKELHGSVFNLHEFQ